MSEHQWAGGWLFHRNVVLLPSPRWDCIQHAAQVRVDQHLRTAELLVTWNSARPCNNRQFEVRTGEMWSRYLAPVTRRAAEFCTDCSHRKISVMPHNSELQCSRPGNIINKWNSHISWQQMKLTYIMKQTHAHTHLECHLQTQRWADLTLMLHQDLTAAAAVTVVTGSPALASPSVSSLGLCTVIVQQIILKYRWLIVSSDHSQ